MELFADAKLNWDLDRLYADLSSIKTLALTDWEKTCLRGLLCGVNPGAIASQIFWTVAALRTELSRRLYPHIAILVDGKIGAWYRVAQLLEKAGYKFPPIKILKPELFHLDVFTNPDLDSMLIRASTIVKLLEERSPHPSYLNSQQLNELSNLEIQNIIQGNQSFKQHNFREAIKYYSQALTINPSRASVVIKIARCYQELEFYQDALYICDFQLYTLDRDNDQSSLDRNHTLSTIYQFLGDLFQELTLKKYHSTYVKTAFDFYQQALYFYPWNTLISWNIVNLFISVFRHSSITGTEKKGYIDKAKKALYDLKGNAHGVDSNFKSYRDLIIEEAETSFAGLENWWLKQLNELKSC
jgi:tetratricopeptide (TPR) repeat protein